MQAGDEAASVDLGAAAGAVAEPDDVGAVLLQAALEGDAFRVVGEGDEAQLSVLIVAHQDGELAACGQRAGAVGDELPVAA